MDVGVPAASRTNSRAPSPTTRCTCSPLAARISSIFLGGREATWFFGGPRSPCTSVPSGCPLARPELQAPGPALLWHQATWALQMLACVPSPTLCLCQYVPPQEPSPAPAPYAPEGRVCSPRSDGRTAPAPRARYHQVPSMLVSDLLSLLPSCPGPPGQARPGPGSQHHLHCSPSSQGPGHTAWPTLHTLLWASRSETAEGKKVPRQRDKTGSEGRGQAKAGRQGHRAGKI